MYEAMEEVKSADYLIIIGTSLNVYPAAGLYHYAVSSVPIYIIDPNDTQPISRKVTFIKEKATTGMRELERLLTINEERKND